jgi:tyrosyl-tRNA synthetase
MAQKTYQEILSEMETAGFVPSEEAQKELANELISKQYGGGMSQAELADFETLIGRLESSKMKQAGQANRARQRDVMAGGLASMMANF